MPSIILDYGRWELTPLSELKLRHAAWNHILTSVEQVLQYGFSNSIPLQIEILQMAQDRLLDAAVHERPVWLRSKYRDPALTYFAQVREWRDHHEERAHAVLQWPHVIAFLYQGGLLWRLALHYGGSRLVSSLSSELSDSAARYKHGRTRHLGYLSDNVSNSEVDILLEVTTRSEDRGKTTQYSWWPWPEWLESRSHFSGQWSPGDEKWFQARLKDIQDQVPRGSPKTAYQWQETLGRPGCAAVGDFILPSQEEIKQALRGLQEQSDIVWDGEKLADTSVPNVL